MTNRTAPRRRFQATIGRAHFVGEEGGDERSTPAKDLVAAGAIALLAVVAMVLAVQLRSPGSLYSAPGLLPFLTGLSLMAMAAGLAAKAIRRGALADMARRRADSRPADDSGDGRRTLLLITMVVLYVLIVGQVSFDLRFPLGFATPRFSSYEAVSIPFLAIVLRVFWRAPSWKCLLIAAIVVIALASVFRYGFNILLPGPD